MKFIDLTGQRFGNLTVLKYVGKNKAYQSIWLCVCDCGFEKEWNSSNLKKPGNHTCNRIGCEFADRYRKEKNETHGLHYTPHRYILNNLISRCINPNNPDYFNYGERGIKVCDRWLNENGLVNFYNDMGERPSNIHMIDREDYDGDYCPENCRWVTPQESAQNTRTNVFDLKLVKLVILEWSINNASILNIKKKLNLQCSDVAVYRVINRETWKNIKITEEDIEYFKQYNTIS